MIPNFVDSNVLIYGAIDRPSDGPKSQQALEILTTTSWACSVQVLQEFYWQTTHPKRPGHLSHQHALEYVAGFCDFPVQEMTVAIFRAAAATAHRYQISYWDAAIIEAARALGCHTVLSEDLQHGQDFGGVRVVDPFR
jgi:predicted nucleic acid-binding protein